MTDSRTSFDVIIVGGGPVGMGLAIVLAEVMKVSAGTNLYDWMTSSVTDIGLPTSLTALGVDEVLLPAIAEKAPRDHLSATNPRPAEAD